MASQASGLSRWLNNGEGSSTAPQRRQSSLAAARKMQELAQQHNGIESGESDDQAKDVVQAAKGSQIRKKRSTGKAKEDDESDAFKEDPDNEVGPDSNDGDMSSRVTTASKRRKTASKRGTLAKLDIDGPINAEACMPPERSHTRAYHRPLLLHKETGRAARDSLLSWFNTVASTRQMPWRKKWTDPTEYDDETSLRSALEKRAYEVWISEVMLQQTRVAVVIDYWNKWTDKWPTIHDLARADPEEVLSAWRGLGYYSRASRIHEAAKKVVNDPDLRGLLPASAIDLEAKVPGVGRYTAGAISSIVFGHAAPMVDGNVLRVLSRQIGLYGNVKSEKAIIDVLWLAADRLVQAVATDGPNKDTQRATIATPISDRPGRWGQALMELGSTICTPKPDCRVCPIQGTCRAFAEGRLLAGKKGQAAARKSTQADPEDIEDLCDLCEPFADDSDLAEQASTAESAKTASARKQITLSSFAFTKKNGKAGYEGLKIGDDAKHDVLSSQALDIIIDHARRFPLKVVKKAVREEETLVCAILRKSDMHYLIQKRPEKGLLAGMWEFPSHTLPEGESKSKQRKQVAHTFVASLLEATIRRDDEQIGLRHVADLGSVPWLFSHLKLTMHVHLFVLEGTGDDEALAELRLARPMRWASDAEVESESMGTGMRKCWALVQAARI